MYFCVWFFRSFTKSQRWRMKKQSRFRVNILCLWYWFDPAFLFSLHDVYWKENSLMYIWLWKSVSTVLFFENRRRASGRWRSTFWKHCPVRLKWCRILPKIGSLLFMSRKCHLLIVNFLLALPYAFFLHRCGIATIWSARCGGRIFCYHERLREIIVIAY